MWVPWLAEPGGELASQGSRSTGECLHSQRCAVEIGHSALEPG